MNASGVVVTSPNTPVGSEYCAGNTGQNHGPQSQRPTGLVPSFAFGSWLVSYTCGKYRSPGWPQWARSQRVSCEAGVTPSEATAAAPTFLGTKALSWITSGMPTLSSRPVGRPAVTPVPIWVVGSPMALDARASSVGSMTI